MVDEDKKEKGFVIKDRRIFGESGEVRGEKKESETQQQQQPSSETKEESKVFTKQEPRRQEEPGTAREEDYPDVNFASFVLSLSTTAMFHFGDFPDPESNKAEQNLPAAKQTIDILGMIQEKTKGNLDANEKDLLEGILYELRMRYVKEKGKP